MIHDLLIAPFSEFAFMRERLRVEIEWLIALSSLGLPELPPLSDALQGELRQLVVQFSIEDCTEIKAIEAETNHDVKAVEYFIKGRTGAALGGASEFIHFACTSEDINNVSHALMLERGRFVLQGRLRAIHAAPSGARSAATVARRRARRPATAPPPT